MQRKWVALATGALVCSIAGTAAAQSKTGGLAIMPFAGYSIPGTLAEDNTVGNDYHFKPQGALILGAQLELGLTKSIGLDIGVNRTLSQKIDVTGGGFSTVTDDFAMLQITGSLVIRPGGRQPNGAVAPLFVELGGGVTRYTVGSAAFTATDWGTTKPMGFAGVGYNLAVGPRTTIQLFGRAQYITKYSSGGLDSFNAQPPASNVVGKGMLNFQFGAGLRVGR